MHIPDKWKVDKDKSLELHTEIALTILGAVVVMQIMVGIAATAHNIYRYLWRHKMRKSIVTAFYVVMLLLWLSMLV